MSLKYQWIVLLRRYSKEDREFISHLLYLLTLLAGDGNQVKKVLDIINPHSPIDYDKFFSSWGKCQKTLSIITGLQDTTNLTGDGSAVFKYSANDDMFLDLLSLVRPCSLLSEMEDLLRKTLFINPMK